MTDERRAARGSQGSTTRRRRTAVPSAGMPMGESGPAEERLAELEARLARLERTFGLRERGRDLMSRVAPPEASGHFRNAGREHLLGIRSIVDFWIGRMETDQKRPHAPARNRRTIKVE